jgi:hypothetical protein
MGSEVHSFKMQFEEVVPHSDEDVVMVKRAALSVKGMHGKVVASFEDIECRMLYMYIAQQPLDAKLVFEGNVRQMEQGRNSLTIHLKRQYQGITEVRFTERVLSAPLILQELESPVRGNVELTEQAWLALEASGAYAALVMPGEAGLVFTEAYPVNHPSPGNTYCTLTTDQLHLALTCNKKATSGGRFTWNNIEAMQLKRAEGIECLWVWLEKPVIFEKIYFTDAQGRHPVTGEVSVVVLAP